MKNNHFWPKSDFFSYFWKVTADLISDKLREPVVQKCAIRQMIFVYIIYLFISPSQRKFLLSSFFERKWVFE